MTRYLNSEYTWTREDIRDPAYREHIIMEGSEAVLLDAAMQIAGNRVLECDSYGTLRKRIAATALSLAEIARRR